MRIICIARCALAVLPEPWLLSTISADVQGFFRVLKCQYLRVANIWTSEHPPQSGKQDTINAHILESLLELFLDTIITLELKFHEFFSLPCQTIKAIGRINYLDKLQLVLFGIPSGLAAADTSSFNALMMEAQGLRSLTLASPVLLPCKPELMAGLKYPSITHLEVEANKDFDSDALLGISIALKPSVKHLTVHDFAFVTVTPLLPIYETLRETIEVLVVNHGSCLSPILHLMFLELRILVVHDGLDSFANLLSQGLFSQAPIRTLAIHSFSIKMSRGIFTVDTFSKLPQLQLLVFMDALSTDYSLPPGYLSACKARNIKCVCS